MIHEPDFSLISSGRSVPRAIGVRAMGMHGWRARGSGTVARFLFPEAPLLDPLYANSLKGSLAKLAPTSSTVRAWKRSRSDIIPKH